MGQYVPSFARQSGKRAAQERIRDLWEKRGDGVQGWEELIEAMITDGTTVSGTLAESIVCPDFNIPRFYLAPGRVLRYHLFGNCQNIATTPGTIIFRVRWGGVGGVQLGATAALQLDTTARTYSNWYWSGSITCRATGSTGLLIHQGVVVLGNRLSTDTGGPVFSSAGGVFGQNSAVQVDTTTDKLLSFTAQFSNAQAQNAITAQQRLLEALN